MKERGRQNARNPVNENLKYKFGRHFVTHFDPTPTFLVFWKQTQEDQEQSQEDRTEADPARPTAQDEHNKTQNHFSEVPTLPRLKLRHTDRNAR